jgi:hypothetical protein
MAGDNYWAGVGHAHPTQRIDLQRATQPRHLERVARLQAQRTELPLQLLVRRVGTIKALARELAHGQLPVRLCISMHIRASRRDRLH